MIRALLAAAALGLGPPGPELPPRFPRLDLKTPEGGLWALCDREEDRLRQSPLRIRDAALDAYLADLVRKLAGAHAPDLRVYLLRTAYFNASMAPNGMLQVWTGLLLHCQNEAQVAAILGHEIAHYLLRHGLEQFKDAKSRSASATLALAVPVIGPLVALGTVAGGFAYTRDQERAADRLGLELMARAGYPPQEAGRIWGNLLEELQAEKDWTGVDARRSLLFATHPVEGERRRALDARAAELGRGGEPGAAALRQAIAPYRQAWFQDELKRRRFGESLALLRRACADDPQDGLAHYMLAEALRLRGEPDDHGRLLGAYPKAAGLPGAPAEVHRALGRLHRQAGRQEEMREAYGRYLALRPDAEDAEMIRHDLKEPK